MNADVYDTATMNKFNEVMSTLQNDRWVFTKLDAPIYIDYIEKCWLLFRLTDPQALRKYPVISIIAQNAANLNMDSNIVLQMSQSQTYRQISEVMRMLLDRDNIVLLVVDEHFHALAIAKINNHFICAKSELDQHGINNFASAKSNINGPFLAHQFNAV